MGKDSNLRRRCQQIYSLPPLATREPIRDNTNMYHLTTCAGLEPATSAVTGRRSNQLSQQAKICRLENFRQNTETITYPSRLIKPYSRTRLRPISNSPLHASLHFHSCPIYLVVFKGSYQLASQLGKSHLGGGFTLRCLQRLSLPGLATLRCAWRHNRYTSGPSTPVLSY